MFDEHLTQLLLAGVLAQLSRLVPILRAVVTHAVTNERRQRALLDHFNIADPAPTPAVTTPASSREAA